MDMILEDGRKGHKHTQKKRDVYNLRHFGNSFLTLNFFRLLVQLSLGVVNFVTVACEPQPFKVDRFSSCRACVYSPSMPRLRLQLYSFRSKPGSASRFTPCFILKTFRCTRGVDTRDGLREVCFRRRVSLWLRTLHDDDLLQFAWSEQGPVLYHKSERRICKVYWQ